MGDYMARLGLIPDCVLCSPAVRTMETWGIIAAALGEPAVPTQSPDALYLAEPETMLGLIRALEPAVCVPGILK